MIPLELSISSFWVENYRDDDNSECLQMNLDLLEEAQDWVEVRMAAYHQKAVRYHDARVWNKFFQVKDHMLWQAKVSQPTTQGRLSLMKEEPYKVEEVIRHGIHYLVYLDGKSLPHLWNSENLWKYYQWCNSFFLLVMFILYLDIIVFQGWVLLMN